MFPSLALIKKSSKKEMTKRSVQYLNKLETHRNTLTMNLLDNSVDKIILKNLPCRFVSSKFSFLIFNYFVICTYCINLLF